MKSRSVSESGYAVLSTRTSIERPSRAPDFPQRSPFQLLPSESASRPKLKVTRHSEDAQGLLFVAKAEERIQSMDFTISTVKTTKI